MSRCRRRPGYLLTGVREERQQARIRQGSAADVDAIRRIVAGVYGPYRARIGRDPTPTSADYAALIGAREVCVAQTAEVVGVLVLRQRGTTLLLENVAVEPKAQGRGIGRELIAFVERRASGMGLSEVALYTNEKMAENIGPRRQAAGAKRASIECASAVGLKPAAVALRCDAARGCAGADGASRRAEGASHDRTTAHHVRLLPA